MPPAFSLTPDNHSYSSETNILTPPLSSHGSERPPYKPLDSDHVSLSMKSTSMKGTRRHQRRWTVPSKASTTRLLCSERPSATLTRSGEATATDTPAMIVLRRASVRKQSLEPAKDSQSEITFFPRPQVTKTSTSLFGFLRLGATQLDGDQSHKNSVDTSAATLLCRPSTSPSPPRKPSMIGNVPLPCASEVAQPAFTALVMDSVGIMHPMQHPRPTLDVPQTTVARRSSTTITTGNSVHEIIWDENVTSSSGSNTASQASRRSTGKSVGNSGDRRYSMAVEKLDLQLKRDTEARRESDTSARSPTHSHGSPSLRDQKSFSHLVDFQFGTATQMPTKPHSLHSTAPAASRLRRASTLHDEEQHVGPMTTKEDDDEPVGHIDCFPPLRSRAGSSAAQERHKSTAMGSGGHVVPDQRKPSMGSALGQSSHVRRRSAAVGSRHAR